MFKTLTMTIVALCALSVTAVNATEAQPNGQERHAAGERARQVLAETLGVATDTIEIKSIESRTWNDSSLGCGKPGSMAMQVITPGYAVVLSEAGREHRVHVAGNNAVVCDRAPLVRKDLRRATQARGLDRMMEQARQDLAKRVDADPATIRIAGIKPHQWADSGMECPVTGEPVQKGPINGYRISLKHLARIYTYHTDLKTVRPCPAIETK